MEQQGIGACKTMFLRLSAFVLFCIDVQIFRDGVSELLEPWKAVAR